MTEVDLGLITMTALKRTRVGKILENSYTEQIQSLIENQDYSFIKTVEEHFDFGKSRSFMMTSAKIFQKWCNEFPLKNSASLSEGKKSLLQKMNF